MVAYSAKGLRFKEKPFLDSITSSTHFVSPAVYGLVLAGAVFTPQLWAVLGAVKIVPPVGGSILTAPALRRVGSGEEPAAL